MEADMRELRMWWVAAVLAVAAVGCGPDEPGSAEHAIGGEERACRGIVGEAAASVGRDAIVRTEVAHWLCAAARPDDPARPALDGECVAFVLAVCEQLGGDPATCGRIALEICGGLEPPPPPPVDPACEEAVR